MGKDFSLVAPNGLGSSWEAVGGILVALLCERAGGPMGWLSYPPAKALKASPWLPHCCGIASRGAWHSSAKEPPGQLPHRSPFHSSAGRKTKNCSSASVSLFFSYEASSKLMTNTLFKGCVLPVVYLPGASSCNPLVSPQLQSPVLQMPRAVVLPSKPPSLQHSRTKRSEEDQASSQKSAVHSLSLEPLFSCSAYKFQSMPAKECLCSAPWHYGGKWSTQCRDLAETFLSLLVL